MPEQTEDNQKKRKLDDVPEIEIDVSAPQPPSKKALRKAKKKGIDLQAAAAAAKAQSSDAEQNTTVDQSTEKEKKKKKKKSKKERSEYGIWIGNLAYSTTKNDIRKFITSNTTCPDTGITRIHLPMEPDKDGKSRNKGFAYVDFATSKAMEEAIELSEKTLLGRRVLIKNAQDFEGRPEEHQETGKSKGKTSYPPSKRVFIGNLAFDATKELVEEHFSPCGTINNVHLATFEDSGKCKGYGWIDFDSVEAGENAVRGFVTVEETDDDVMDEDEDEDVENSDSDAAEKPKKTRTRKISVKRFMGRVLRREFAEDPTTRYKKRFGKPKPSKKKKKKTNESESTPIVANGQKEGKASAQKKAKKKDAEQTSRYSKDTVQRLTGAIVESQGKKITFD